jgi:hypothetical protein
MLTTRRDVDWQRLAVAIQLDILTPEAAARGHHRPHRPRHQPGPGRRHPVAEELGFLPLALDQAAAYMIQARIRPGQYLDSLRRNPARPDHPRVATRLGNLAATYKALAGPTARFPLEQRAQAIRSAGSETSGAGA